MFLHVYLTNILYISGEYISKIKKWCNVKPSAHHFYVKTKILVNLYICISVSLKAHVSLSSSPCRAASCNFIRNKFCKPSVNDCF